MKKKKKNRKQHRKGSVKEFNLEIIYGELGAIIGAPLLGFIVSLLSTNENVISASAVAGSIIGGAIIWISTRLYHKKERGEKAKSLFSDIAYFTPAAFLTTLLVYYPTLFFFSRHLLTGDRSVLTSVISAQISAFLLFLIVINLYRIVLIRRFHKTL